MPYQDKKQAGFTQIIVLLLLAAGLGLTVYLVQQKTNFFPKAAVSEPITPIPTGIPTVTSFPTSYPTMPPTTPTQTPRVRYYLETWPTSNVNMTPGTFAVNVLLKDTNNDRVVTNQSDLRYDWSVDPFPIVEVTSYCAKGVQPPCPMTYATIKAASIGATTSTNVRVKVFKSSSATPLATAEFNVNLVQPDVFVTVGSVYPQGGETFKNGSPVTITWGISYLVDYFNIYYQYYLNGVSKGGYIGTAMGKDRSFNWVIPKELRGQKVRVMIEPRKGGLVVGLGYSNNYFQVK